MSEHDPIQQACESYMDFVASKDFNEDRMEDYENEIFEAAMDFYWPGWADKVNAAMDRED